VVAQKFGSMEKFRLSKQEQRDQDSSVLTVAKRSTEAIRKMANNEGINPALRERLARLEDLKQALR
jgi:hypothetical protein